MSAVALARQATAEALRMRVRHGRPLSAAICPYDLAMDEGIEVRFEPIATLEGIYRAGATPLIVVGSLRPRGRRAYTCAHELGHHALGHGTRVDELLEGADDIFDAEEYAAECFASALLMPKMAVDTAFSCRGLSAAKAGPTEILAVASYLGVGYSTLIGHLERTLGALPAAAARELRRHTPSSIGQGLAGPDTTASVVIVDRHWADRPIDVEVGDFIRIASL